jgi:membrane-associated phospholipid phosphatase
VRPLLAGLLAVAVAAAPVAAADDPAPPPAARVLLHNLWQDQKAIWTSPLHIKRKHASRLVAFSLVAAALIATDRRASNALPNTPGQIDAGNAVSYVGASYTTFGLPGALFFLGRAAGNDRAQEAGLLGAEALVDATLVSTVAKLLARRERPGSDNGSGHFWAGGSSFPSGHAITSWALAEVIAGEYQDKPLVRIGAYGLATAVSLARVAARKHFPSDVLAGSVGGLLIGRYVYRAHHESRRRWSLAPIARIDPATHTYALSLECSRK